MDYEKKYNEALERARNVHRNYKNLFPEDSYSEDIEEIFPELRESEDERIRKAIIHYILYETKGTISEATEHTWVKWLEKQKEPKQTDLPAGFYYIDLDGNKYYSKEFRYGDMKVKVGEQKPINSFDIVPYIDDKIAALQDMWREEKVAFDWDDMHEMIEDVARHFYQKEQKPAEWSEDDEKMFCNLIGIMEGKTGVIPGGWKKYVDWMKNRYKYSFPMPHWKPSEEHLSALLAIFNDPNSIGSQTCQLALTDLYEQLKKL